MEAIKAAAPEIPRELAPRHREAAVLSGLSDMGDERWKVIAGSLITVPADVAQMSWPAWETEQPETRGLGPRRAANSDLGARFSEEPFDGIQIFRLPVARDDWDRRVGEMEAGLVQLPSGTHFLEVSGWGATKLFAQHGTTDPHEVLRATRRPVRGVSALTAEMEMPHSEAHWVRHGSSKPLERQTREELHGKDVFTHWPDLLTGVHWLGGAEHPPPRAFVVGRVEGGVWIADVVLEHEDDQLRIVLGWEAEQMDPFSCSLVVRAEQGGAPLLVGHWKVSDLPGELVTDEFGREPRDLGWNRRTLNIRLPRGARGTEWGASLYGPDGSLLDELPVARRVERIEMTIGIAGSGSGITSVVGDRKTPPGEADRSREAGAARLIESDTRAAAARRRLARTDELKDYLRWRFSARDGELLIIDRYLLDGGKEKVARVLPFLDGLDRDIRAVVTKVEQGASTGFSSMSRLAFRVAPKGSFHDRLWIVGEAGLSVGGSLNQILSEEKGGKIPTTTAVDLPFADVAAWRAEFEMLWSSGEPI